MFLDFILFSIWESLIFYLFINKLSTIKLKWIDIIIVGVLFCVSSIVPPLFRQLLGICILTFLIFMFRNKEVTISRLLYILKWVTLEYIYALICEMIYCSIIDSLNIVESYNTDSLTLFKFFILLRIVEVIIIFIINKIKRREKYEAVGGFRRYS